MFVTPVANWVLTGVLAAGGAVDRLCETDRKR